MDTELDYSQLPEGIKKFMIPAFLRQATKSAFLSRDTATRETVVKLLISHVDVMSDVALEEAKSIGAGVDPSYERVVTDIGIERLQFLYSILISHAIRSAALEGLILLSGKVKRCNGLPKFL